MRLLKSLKVLGVSAALGPAYGATACTDIIGSSACTKMGCEDLVVVEFATPLDGAEEYVIEVEFEAATQAPATCTSVRYDPETPEPGCDDRIRPMHGNKALSGVHLTTVSSRKIHLSVRHEGTLIIDESTELTYRTRTPNGEGCGPICTQASWTIEN